MRTPSTAAYPADGLFLAVMILAILLSAPLPVRAEPPAATDGFLDLSEWNPTADGPTRLDGTWDFYWRELVLPGESAERTPVPITVPRFWHRTMVIDEDGHRTNAGRGYGTYRIRVRLPPNPPPLALRLGNINTAVAVYAQDQLVWSAGKVTEDRRTAIPSYRPGIALLPPVDGPVLELTVHVSSFVNARGGLDDPIRIGLQKDVIAQRTRALTRSGLLTGGLLIMGVYHLFLFFLRRRSRVFLYFSFVCFSAVGRLGFNDEILLLEFWPEMPWSMLVKGIYFFVFAIFGSFTLYLRSLWPQAAPAIFYRSVLATAGASCLAVLVIPVSVLTHGLFFLEIFVVASILMATVVFLVAVRRREAGRWIYAAGFLFVAVGGLREVLVAQGFLARAFHFEPIGIFVFLLAQSLILAQRFSAALATEEKQRGELQELVDRFERERRERKRYEELSLAASGLAHETKNPLGVIRGLAQRLVSSSETATSTRRSAGQILDQADRAASRIGDFLNYARLRDPKSGPVEIDRLLRYAAEVLAPDLEAKSIPCRFDVDEATVLADEEMLLQIVLNLVLNSIAACDSGEALELGFQVDEKGRGRLTIVDHGTGIAPDMLDEVRKPYVSGRADGHGLGLALVERMAEQHGWFLRIESTLGAGTRVEIQNLEILPAEHDSGVRLIRARNA